MNWSKKSKLVLVLLFLVAIGGFTAYKIIYKPHPAIENQKAIFMGTADAFKTEVALHQEKWLNGILELKGKFTSLDDKGAMLNETIYCQFKNAKITSGLSVGKEVIIKGRFIGYDDLLEEIKLDQCIINQ